MAILGPIEHFWIFAVKVEEICYLVGCWRNHRPGASVRPLGHTVVACSQKGTLRLGHNATTILFIMCKTFWNPNSTNPKITTRNLWWFKTNLHSCVCALKSLLPRWSVYIMAVMWPTQKISISSKHQVQKIINQPHKTIRQKAERVSSHAA